jgi:hypothetical protein
VLRGLVREVLGLGGAVLGGVVLEAGVGEEADLEVEVGVEEEGEGEDAVVVVVEGVVVAAVDRDMIPLLSLFVMTSLIASRPF